jgi:hypothetical protein
MTGQRLALCLLTALAPMPALANALTFDFRPSDDPRATVQCTVQLQQDFLVAVEIEGMGAPPQSPLRWAATEAETLILLHALGDFVSQDIVSVDDPNLARPPDPPYASIRWFAQTGDGLQSGLYLQPGLALPPALHRVVQVLLLGGPCADLATG